MGIPPSETVNEFEIIELDQIKISWSSQYMYIYIFNIISIKINIPRSSPIISVLSNYENRFISLRLYAHKTYLFYNYTEF